MESLMQSIVTAEINTILGFAQHTQYIWMDISVDQKE